MSSPLDLWVLESKRADEDWSLHEWYRSKERAEEYRDWNARYYAHLGYEYRIVHYRAVLSPSEVKT